MEKFGQDIVTSDLVTGVKSCRYYQAKLRQIARWAVWMLMLRCLVEKQLWWRTINHARTAFDGNEDEVIAIDGWIFKLVSWFDRLTLS